MMTYGLLRLLLLNPWSTEFAPMEAPMPIPATHRLGIVFVADGAGESTTVADNTQKILAARAVPFCRYAISWSRSVTPSDDYRDYDAQMAGARRLARLVIAYRATYPNEKIYLVGHSAGTHVVLAAASMLPPNTVDRIAVTAPMVSCRYDLRIALRSSRDGIDVWFSSEDGLAAEASEKFGTADRQPGRTAAELGFVAPPPDFPEAALYHRLRQYPYQNAFMRVGHDGGHFGFSRLSFLDAYVLPTMLTPRKH